MTSADTERDEVLREAAAGAPDAATAIDRGADAAEREGWAAAYVAGLRAAADVVRTFGA